MNSSNSIDLKCQNPYFSDIWNGDKTFEVRRDDRPEYNKGRVIRLREYDPETGYSGRCVVIRITYIMRDAEYVKPGFCIFGFDILHYRIG